MGYREDEGRASFPEGMTSRRTVDNLLGENPLVVILFGQRDYWRLLFRSLMDSETSG